MKLIEWDPKVSAGNILTVVSILISVFALAHSASQDREQRERELADARRTAAATVIVKMHQWEQLSELYFQDIQSPIVAATEKYAETSFNEEVTRDYLWKSLDESRSQYYNRKLEQGISTSYIDLFGYNTCLGQQSFAIVQQIQEDERQMFQAVQASTQEVILTYEFQGRYYTADLGDKLRFAVAPVREHYLKKMKDDIAHLEESLTALMEQSDPTRDGGATRAAPVQPCATLTQP